MQRAEGMQPALGVAAPPFGTTHAPWSAARAAHCPRTPAAALAPTHAPAVQSTSVPLFTSYPHGAPPSAYAVVAHCLVIPSQYKPRGPSQLAPVLRVPSHATPAWVPAGWHVPAVPVPPGATH